MGGEEGEEFKRDSPVPCLGVCAELAQAFDELLLTARLREPVTLTSLLEDRPLEAVPSGKMTGRAWVWVWAWAWAGHGRGRGREDVVSARRGKERDGGRTGCNTPPGARR